MQALIDNAAQYIQTSPWLAVVAVFVGGALTASSPCVLAMIPLTMSFVAGQDRERATPGRAFLLSMILVCGLALTYTALGMFAALAGSVYGEVSGAWTWIVAAVCLLMGLHLLGALNFTIPVPINVQPRIRGPLGAFVMGLLFGVVSAPCAAPMLVVLLTYLAGTGSSVPYGALLLLVYALGHSVLILVAGTSVGMARKLIESRGITRATDIMRRGAGVVIIGVGIFFIYNGLK